MGCAQRIAENTMNTLQPSAEALRLAENLLANGVKNRSWYMSDPQNLAAVIDRELQLPQRNAALLLAQALMDANDACPYAKPSAVIAALAEPIDHLREALKAIKTP